MQLLSPMLYHALVGFLKWNQGPALHSLRPCMHIAELSSNPCPMGLPGLHQERCITKYGKEQQLLAYEPHPS